MNKPNLPEDTTNCSWRSLKAGGLWLILAMLAEFAGGTLLNQHKDWPTVLRAAVGLLPLLLSVLYVRSTVRWIRGMDELHRRITMTAILFAAVVYLFFNAVWLALDRAGVFAAIAQATPLHVERLDFRSCALTLGLTYVLWGIGYTLIFNRRFNEKSAS